MKLPSFVKKPSFINVGTLFTGSTISQLILFLTLPLLTRLFDENYFGVYVLFTTSVLVLKTIMSLSLELTILLPKKNEDAFNLFFLNIIVSVLLSLISYLFLFVFELQISTTLGLEGLGFFIYLIPLSSMLICFKTALEYWNNRLDTFKNISFGAVGKSIAVSSSQISIGYSSFKSIGLISGQIIGQLFHLILILKLSYNSFEGSFKKLSIDRIFSLLKQYRRIPLFNTLMSFLNTLSNELPVVLISNFFGLGSVGIYGLSLKISNAFSALIGSSVGQVFFNEASKLYNAKGNLYHLLKTTYRRMFLVGLLLFTILFVASFYFQVLLGNDWSDVGRYTRVLIPWLFIAFLNFPVSSLITILSKQKLFLIYDSLLLVFRFLSIYVGFTFFSSMYISICLFSIVGFLFNLFLFCYLLLISKNHKNY